MKVLRIIARLNVGGPARHVVWLTEDLNDGEFESVLIAGAVPAGEESMNYLAAERGVHPIFIEEMSRELSPKDLISLVKIYREIRRVRPDIIHTHTAKAGTVGRAAALLYRISTMGRGRPRVVHTFHGHVFHSYYGSLKTRLFLTIEKLLARVATDKIVVISPQQRAEISERFRVGRQEQFEVIPLGIDVEGFAASTEKRSEFRAELGLGNSEIVVGFVGRLTEIKDLSLYLHVAAEVSKAGEIPTVRFLIAGDGHLRPALEREAQELGITETVRFLGNRTDADRVYAGLDIVALTSLNEGTPLSLIEAMAAGKPVISTLVGGVVDLLGDSVEQHEGFQVCERGVGIEGRSPGDYAKGLIYLVKNERLRETLAEKGRVFASSEYSKDRLVNDIKALYRKLVPRI
ncbi:MAG TPA: glycosyltransferase [Pyrinomonadaceae bacterium]|nr:glycosyltransferase [Pyrinomonadaceae bacterium]